MDKDGQRETTVVGLEHWNEENPFDFTGYRVPQKLRKFRFERPYIYRYYFIILKSFIYLFNPSTLLASTILVFAVLKSEASNYSATLLPFSFKVKEKHAIKQCFSTEWIGIRSQVLEICYHIWPLVLSRKLQLLFKMMKNNQINTQNNQYEIVPSV